MSVFQSILGLIRSGWLRHMILVALGVFLAVLLGLAWLGFPGVVAQWILDTANAGEYFVTAKSVKLDLRGGLAASDVMVYRKGLTGPPLLETRRMQVLFHIFELPRRGETRVKEVRARGGILRPLWGTGGAAGLAGGVAQAGKALVPGEGRAGSFTALDMDVVLSDFDLLGMWVEQARAAVRMDQEGFRLSRLSGTVGRDLQRGTIEGTLFWSPQHKAVGRLVTSFDPHALSPVCALFCPEAIPILDRFSFSATPPRLELAVEADLRKPAGVKVEGRMQASRYAYLGAGIGFGNLAGEYVYGNGTNRFRLDPFLILAGGRKAVGKTDFDFAAGTAVFEVVSEIDLATVLRMVGVREQAMTPWSFEEGSRIVARGEANLRRPETSRIEATVEGANLAFHQVRVSDYAFRYDGLGLTNRFHDIRGKIGGGSFSGAAVLVRESSGSNLTSQVRAELIHADADEVVKLLSTNLAWRAGGKVYGNIELAGRTSGSGTIPLSAEGQLTLRHGKILGLPLFQGLVTRLVRFVPGVNPGAIPVEARIAFRLANGRVESEDIQIGCGPFILTAEGSCGLDGTLDYRGEARPAKRQGALGQAITSWFSSGAVIGFKLEGTLHEPRWSRRDK